ncbi:MAG: hypothetical protein ACJ74Y_03580 [Bryobacteraceae bacterium]
MDRKCTQLRKDKKLSGTLPTFVRKAPALGKNNGLRSPASGSSLEAGVTGY